MKDQTITEIPAINFQIPVPTEHQFCTECNNELVVHTDVRRTRFGLRICDDCLYC